MVDDARNRQPDEPTLVDLALGQGEAAALDRLRASLARDPVAAIEFAETRQLLERLRGVQTAPSPQLPARLEELARKAEWRQAQRQRTPITWRVLLGGLAAAAALFAALAWLDPLALRAGRGQRLVCATVAPAVAAAPAEPTAPKAAVLPATLARTFEAASRLEPGSRLAQALDRFEGAAASARLAQWLSPRNALAVLRLDRELRASAPARQRALRDRGLLDFLDGRLQSLVAGIAADLRSDTPFDTDATAFAVRALVAAGCADDVALRRGVERLVAALPSLTDAPLATALAALAETALATDRHAAALREHGQRLVDEVLAVDAESWSRRRPRLLASSAAPAAIADAGQFLRLASEFGVDADEALVVRLLLAARLQERRDPGNETPEVPTALVYGFADLLGADERQELESRLRSWRPSALVSDYRSLLGVVATRGPAQSGYARFQLELRRLCALAPTALCDRAALCRALASALLPTPLAAGVPMTQG